MYDCIDLTVSCWQAAREYAKHFGFEYPLHSTAKADPDMLEKDIRERIRDNNPAPKEVLLDDVDY